MDSSPERRGALEFLGYVKRMTHIMCAVGLLILAALWMILPAGDNVIFGRIWANGYALGLIASVAAFALIDGPAALHSVASPQNAAKIYYRKLLFSLLVYAGAIIIALVWKNVLFQPYGTLLGFITPKLILIGESVLHPSLPSSIPTQTDIPPVEEEEEDDFWPEDKKEEESGGEK